MSNLGFQTVYYLLNKIDHVVCERAFLPEDGGFSSSRILTIESKRPISDFDIIAFSVSFENDYSNILTILKNARLPLQSTSRRYPHPLVVAGGVACFLNPEPIAIFIDCFLMGETEELFPLFFDIYKPDDDRESCLKSLAVNIPGTYVPAFYNTLYNPDGTILSFEPVCDVPDKIKRVYPRDISNTSTCSTIITPETTFKDTFLIEIGRGCPHGCRFCAAGYIYRPPRFRSISTIKKCMAQGSLLTDKIGLVGAAVSDLPEIEKLLDIVLKNDIKMSFSSLRADSITPELVSVLKQSKIKTATIAPDAGSERMRRVINKGINEEDIFNAVEILVGSGILNLKLYFMIGLPTETMDDVMAIINMCRQIKKIFLHKSRERKKIGKITVSLNSFVPKPFTPFQWVAMDNSRSLKAKVKQIKNGLKSVANMRLKVNTHKSAYIQALFSRGDRLVARILSLALETRGNWPKTFKTSDINSDFYVTRERFTDEIFPWDFIDNGIHKSFLEKEYKLALQGKTSRPCPMDPSCNICGVCGKK